MNTNQRNSNKIKRLTTVAMFCALAFALTYIKFPVGFLSLEIKDSVIVLCTLIFGPLAGLPIAIMVPLLEMITHSSTGVYGLIMNMLSSVTFSMVTGVIYKYRRNFHGAMLGLVSGVFAVTAIMMLANLLVTPFYMGVPIQEVAALIPKMLLPFNLVKALLNGGVVLLLYKPLSDILKKAGLVGARAQETGVENTEKKPLRSVVVTLIAVVVIVASLMVIFMVLK